MSIIAATLEQIESIIPHPNADRLEIAKILGTQTIVSKGEYKVNDRVVFFPPDVLIPSDISSMLGVQKYLKQSEIDGVKCQCRVAACRLRGYPSYGFIIPAPVTLAAHPLGCDVSTMWAVKKYEPAQKRQFHGDIAANHPAFHKYTDIQHYWRHPKIIKPGTLVRITEKIHGTQCRVGMIRTSSGFQVMGGSHRTNRKKLSNTDNLSLYWQPLENKQILNLLICLCDDKHNVVIFGEIFGKGIQDLDYGVDLEFRVFDISVDGLYLDYNDLVYATLLFEVATVPLLYLGPLTSDIIDLWTNGPTIFTPKCKFKGREGCVVTPLVDEWNPIGRVIFKSVSADYLDRKHATDKGEL